MPNRDAGSRIGAQHLEPTQPTLFEYVRRSFDIPAHQALLINGEDRPQEEFFTYAAHKHYGVAYRSEILSLHRFKLFKLRRILNAGKGTDKELADARKEFDKLMEKGLPRLRPPPVGTCRSILGAVAPAFR